MNARLPSVAVIIPCRNMAPFLREALESVFAQDVHPAEVVVVDDNSTDDPQSVVRAFGDRVRLIAGPGRGSAVARNIGILETRSELIAFLDADDLWRPGFLSASIRALRDGAVGLSFSNWQREDAGVISEPVFGSYYSCVAEGSVFSALLRENWICTPGVVVKRQVLARSGLFDPELIGGQDFELWLRLARVTKFACVGESMVVIRQHGQNITSSRRYPFHHVKMWRTVLVRHVDVSSDDRARIRHRAAVAAYEAGRHAIRHGEYEIARPLLREATLRAPGSPRYRLWSAAACILPDAVLSRLVQIKRWAARGSSTGPGS